MLNDLIDGSMFSNDNDFQVTNDFQAKLPRGNVE